MIMEPPIINFLIHALNSITEGYRGKSDWGVDSVSSKKPIKSQEGGSGRGT